MKLYKVEATIEFVMVSDGEPTKDEMKDSLTDVIENDGYKGVALNFSPVNSLSDLPNTWRGASIPWGDNPDEYTCQQLLDWAQLPPHERVIKELEEGGSISREQVKALRAAFVR